MPRGEAACLQTQRVHGEFGTGFGQFAEFDRRAFQVAAGHALERRFERVLPLEVAHQPALQICRGERFYQVVVRCVVARDRHAVVAGFGRDHEPDGDRLQQFLRAHVLQQLLAVGAAAEVVIAQHQVKRLGARPGGDRFQRFRR